MRRIYRPVLFCAGWSGSGVVRLAGRHARRRRIKVHPALA
jgi:hypothetical protein